MQIYTFLIIPYIFYRKNTRKVTLMKVKTHAPLPICIFFVVQMCFLRFQRTFFMKVLSWKATFARVSNPRLTLSLVLAGAM